MQLNFPFLSAASNADLKPGCPLRWKKRLVKDVRLLLPLTETIKIVSFSATQLASSVIAKAKVEAWQTTCSFLSPKSNPKAVYSILHFVAGSFSSSSSSSNFPSCSSPRESDSVFANYLRSHFLVCSQRFCVAEPEATFPSSTEPRALRSLIRPFASPSPR